MKIVVSQRFLPHYRVPLFENVVRRLGADGHELRLYYSLKIGKVGLNSWAIRLFAIKKSIKLGEIAETAAFAPSLFFRLILYRPDVVVTEDLAGLPNSLVVSAYCRLFGKRYLVWGLGNIPGKKPSRLRGLLKPAIRFLYSGASGFICYNKRAAGLYGQSGKPTFVASNACMPRPSAQATQAVLEQIETKYDSATLGIVTVGELKEQKRVDVLLRALAILKNPSIKVDIVGDGPEREKLTALCHELGIAASVRFVGAIYDAARKAEVFRNAGLCVLPGRGGLVIQELMSYGVPVICGTADGTESDFIMAGENGVLLDDATDPQKLASAIASFMSAPVEKRRQMARQAHSTIIGGWHIEGMANAYCNAILAVSGIQVPPK
jgi:glycosyltransferase involved in cell wall biosynthesis